QPSFRELYCEIRQLLSDLHGDELRNMKSVLLCLRRGEQVPKAIQFAREHRLGHLSCLLDAALPAGIAAGYSGEHVEKVLEKLMDSVEKMLSWDRGDGNEPDGTTAWFYLQRFRDRAEAVWANLQPLVNIQAVAADFEEEAAAPEALSKKTKPGHRSKKT